MTDDVLLREVQYPFGIPNASHHHMLWLAGYSQSTYHPECAHPFWYFVGNALACKARTKTLISRTHGFLGMLLPAGATSLFSESRGGTYKVTMLQHSTQVLLNDLLSLDLPLRVAVVNLPFTALRRLIPPDGKYFPAPVTGWVLFVLRPADGNRTRNITLARLRDNRFTTAECAAAREGIEPSSTP